MPAPESHYGTIDYYSRPYDHTTAAVGRRILATAVVYSDDVSRTWFAFYRHARMEVERGF